jgi:hypothetical protein
MLLHVRKRPFFPSFSQSLRVQPSLFKTLDSQRVIVVMTVEWGCSIMNGMYYAF